MPSCAIITCKARSQATSLTKGGTSFHSFPRRPEMREKWIEVTGRKNWFPTKTSTICSKHFTENDFRITCSTHHHLKADAVPSQNIVRIQSSVQVSKQEVQPGPSKPLGTSTSLDPNASTIPEQDPLSRVVIEQCRFCGEFSKDCISVSSNMPYLAHNKTTLVLNHTSVQLDFNDGSLPNTVCRDCDAKLQEIADFVKVVKAAQDTLINVAEERAEFAETRIEIEVARAELTKEDTETETLIIKTEYDSQHEESDDGKEDKEGIVDSLTVGETVFVKKTVTHKRKSDSGTAKQKKHKTKKCDDEIMIDIKEEVIEKDGQGKSEVSDYVKPSELELATSALVFEMTGEGNSEYQGYRSDR